MCCLGAPFMSGPQIWDISQRLGARTPTWPGEPGVQVSRHVEIADGNPVNVGAVTMGLHSGTHADAPVHYDPDGLSSAESALEPYVGPCVLLDVSKAASRVEIADVDWASVEGETRVLFKTYARFPHSAWDEAFCAIAPEVIVRLREAGVNLVGSDAPSLDPQESKTMDAHHEIAKGDMRILEGLVFDDIPAGRYELIALPLALEDADASPVRAILRELK